MTGVLGGCHGGYCNVYVFANKCGNAKSMSASAPGVPTACDLVFPFPARVCRHTSARGYTASISRWMWSGLWVVWGQEMYGSTVPEASKLPVIFLMMQRSVHNHRESILLCCSRSASPAHRLTGCHNNPRSRSMLIRTEQWEAHRHATTLVTTPSTRIHWISDKCSLFSRKC